MAMQAAAFGRISRDDIAKMRAAIVTAQAKGSDEILRTIIDCVWINQARWNGCVVGSAANRFMIDPGAQGA